MKAAVYYEGGGPEVLQYEDIADPVVDKRHVLIEVHAISIEGGDVLARGFGPTGPTPYCGGYLASGVIIEIGSEVTDRFVGQRVTTADNGGSHASLRSVNARSAWPIPDDMLADTGACIPIPFGTADDSLFEFGRLTAGETVLIHAGASGTGLAGIQLAKRAGATVIATASSSSRLDRLKEYGLDYGINYTEVDFEQAARELTEGKGPNLIVDSIGGKNLEKSLVCAAYRGRIVAMGGAGRDSYQPNFAKMAGQNKTYVSYFQGAELAMNGKRARANVQRLIDEVAKGDLKVVIDKTFKLSEADKAHAYIESRQAFGRVVLVPDELAV
ncbi:MAG TPA: zinc-binding alcohol dehydrogenase family protein [Gammaproteobacteria bacterium]|nr:zinc-binding alcohol dehydrogenase family protein [Gammaproteobacteria bacterium]